MSDIKDEYFKFRTYVPEVLLLQKGLFGDTYYGNISYSANFSFKDGKVKFNISEVEMTAWTKAPIYYVSPGGLTWSIFKSNGKPSGDLAAQYQNYFNKYVADYMKFINNEKKNNDNW